MASIKNIIPKLFLLFYTFSFFACEEQKEEYSDIQIGKDSHIAELSLNKQMEKKLLVSGGNGKYIVNIENSQIASATMSMDTLKIKGLLEGTTFVTIISQDKRARLTLNVTFPEISISHSSLLLQPRIRRKFVSISGGGEKVLLEEKDPADIMDIKWDGFSGLLEINPKYEGEAEIIAISEDGKERKKIFVKVKPKGELVMPGWYTTNASLYYPVINNKMVIKRKGVGTWIATSARPYGGRFSGSNAYSMHMAPVINPQKGDSIDLDILSYDAPNPVVKTGIQRLYIEEVRESEVMMRGRGFKFLLPYEK